MHIMFQVKNLNIQFNTFDVDKVSVTSSQKRNEDDLVISHVTFFPMKELDKLVQI